MEVKASVPQPPPKDGGIEVTPKLIEWMKSVEGMDDEIKRDMIALIMQRDAYGLGKYKTRLKTDNGRNQCEDARQELGDFIQYIFACILEKRDGPEVERLIMDAMVMTGFLYTKWIEMKKGMTDSS